MIPTCATCKHWAGDSSAFIAACNNEDVATARTMFDAVCMLYEPRTVAPVVDMQSNTRADTFSKCGACTYEFNILVAGWVCVVCGHVRQ